MADICKRFEPDEFFKQHPLKVKTPYYDDVKCFVIYAAAPQSGLFLDELIIGMRELPIQNADEFDEYLEALLEYDFTARQFPAVADLALGINFLDFVRNPLDFSVYKKTAVLIRLIGQFWQFSNSMAAISTKQDLDSQYYSPTRHRQAVPGGDPDSVPDGKGLADYRCISFCTDKPCRQNLLGLGQHVKHGFSLNLDLIMPNKAIVPITFDPDIENKGAG